MRTILITGASGSIAAPLIPLLARTGKLCCRLFLRDSAKNRDLFSRWQRDGLNVEPFWGNLCDADSCLKAVAGCELILHCGALIPPATLHHPDLAWQTNIGGTRNILAAIKAQPNSQKIRLIYTGTVAQYGYRNYLHPWGRVGDPLLPGPYEVYGSSKVRAERLVIESSLERWVSLRLSPILYDGMILRNMGDGLIFQTPLNTCLEWTTTRCTTDLISKIITAELADELPPSFWRRVYNVGGGAPSRTTYYETLAAGLKLIGSSPKYFFRPHWFATRNFSGMWMIDSDILIKQFDFTAGECFTDFFNALKKKLWYYKVGFPLRRLIRSRILRPLAFGYDAPAHWAEHGPPERAEAFYGPGKTYAELPRFWHQFPLLCENRDPATGVFLDYHQFKSDVDLRARGYYLGHGYDDTRPDAEIELPDLISAAEFRGGACLAETMTKGDMYTELPWRCHQGHEFSASPYLILRAGHWCPVCCQPEPWNFDELARHIPFFAQVWYDTHHPDERNFYPQGSARDITAARAGAKQKKITGWVGRLAAYFKDPSNRKNKKRKKE